MKQLPAVIVWAIAFAYVEASVVEYLRAMYYPLAKGGFQFPLLTLEQLSAMGAEHHRRLLIELGRELATLVMLVTLGAVAGRNKRQAWAHFMIAFGIWDIFYYLWLRVFLGWPSTICDWDLLFIVPVPWVSPAIAPIIISIVLIFSGITILYYESVGKPMQVRWGEWFGLVAGGLVVIASFCWDYQNIMLGGLPNPFKWSIFSVGLAIGLGIFLRIVFRSSRTHTNIQSFS